MRFALLFTITALKLCNSLSVRQDDNATQISLSGHNTHASDVTTPHVHQRDAKLVEPTHSQSLSPHGLVEIDYNVSFAQPHQLLVPKYPLLSAQQLLLEASATLSSKQNDLQKAKPHLPSSEKLLLEENSHLASVSRSVVSKIEQESDDFYNLHPSESIPSHRYPAIKKDHAALQGFITDITSIIRAFHEIAYFYLPVPYSAEEKKIYEEELQLEKSKKRTTGSADTVRREALLGTDARRALPHHQHIPEGGSTPTPHPLSRLSPSPHPSPLPSTSPHPSPLPSPSPSPLSSQCQRDVDTIFAAFSPPRRRAGAAAAADALMAAVWPLRMIDSWGKSEDGILEGNSSPLGFMKECLGVVGFTKSEDIEGLREKFTGQYCLVQTRKLKNTTSLVRIFRKYGTCIPSSCTAAELQTSLNTQLSSLGYAARSVSCQQQHEPLYFGTWEVVGCVAIAAMVLPVLLATIADLCFPSDKISPVLKAFSAAENLAKILAVRIDVPGEISCIHAIRVLSICWVMLGHQYIFMLAYAANIKEFPEMTADWPYQVVWSGYKAVDTFFTIGGLLQARSFLVNNFCTENTPKHTKVAKLSNNNQQYDLETVEAKTLKNLQNGDVESESQGNNCKVQCTSSTCEFKGDLTDDQTNNSFFQTVKRQGIKKTILIFVSNYIQYVIHRIVRIVPTIFIVIMFCAGPAVLFVSGPHLDQYKDTTLKKCRQNWWIDMVFLTNYYYTQDIAGCLPQAWYVAVDFQIYLVAPFLMLPMKLTSRKFLYMASVSLLFCLIPGIIVAVENLVAAQFLTTDMIATDDFFKAVYIEPYARASPYFIGAVVAILLHEAGSVNKNEKLPWLDFLSKKVVLAAGWLAFGATCLAVVFGQVNMNNFVKNDPYAIGGFARFVYASFDIAAWAICIGWMVMLCCLGLAGPLNTFLSHPMWQPLSRVTFSVYLISLPLQELVFAGLYRNIYLTHTIVLLTYCGIVVLSFATSFFISLVAEAPFIALLKLLSRKGGRQQKNK